VTYDSSFDGETPSGYLNLVIDMSLENSGYATFNTSPSNFAVEVGDYSYPVKESDLDTVELPDGDIIQGRLTFEVPPQAAIPGIGYALKYSGQGYNVRLVEGTGTPGASEPASGPEIEIAYSTRLMWLSPPGTQYLKVDPPGNLYLIVEMTIQNNGYGSFSTNPDFFTAEVSNALRSVTSNVEEELIDWRDFDLANGGKFVGSLAFHVPTEVAQDFYPWEYKMIYTGVRSFNIDWMKKNLSMCTFDPTKTELEAVDLSDNGSISGKLAFLVTPESTAPGAKYEMFYDEKTPHNVQWFDRPDALADVNRNPVSYPVIKITYSTSLLREDPGRLYLMVDVLIENKGYESFNTAPGHFYLEISY